MNSVDDETIMITIFGGQTTFGLVRFYSTGTAHSLSGVLVGLREKSRPGFQFDADPPAPEPAAELSDAVRHRFEGA